MRADDDRTAIMHAATHRLRQNDVRTDSESHGLATKKFSLSQRSGLADARRNELFGRIAIGDSDVCVTSRRSGFGSRETIETSKHAAMATSPTA
jgi:hypothetical protein